MNLSNSLTTRGSHSPDISAPPDDNPARHKRQRISRACQPCRKSKLKCNGAKPRCATCSSAKRVCSYTPNPRRRGLKTGYVRALECLWALVFQNVANSETTVENLAKKAFQKGLRFREEDNNVDYSIPRLLEIWRSSRVQLLIDDALDASEDSDDENTKIHSEPDAHANLDVNTAEWSLKDDAAESVPAFPREASPTIAPQKDSEKVQDNSTNNPYLFCEGSGVVLDASSTPKPPVGSRELLDIFFSYTQSWLPIVERHSVFRTFYTLGKGPSPSTGKVLLSGDHAVLWAILSYTSLRQLEKNDHQTSRNQAARCESMYEYARSLIPWAKPGETQLSYVQALLFLALYKYTTGEWSIAWRLTGQAIILAKELGVEQPQGGGTDISQRVWLGCFTLDTMISAQRQRPPLLRESDIQYCCPLDDTGLDEWEPWRGRVSQSSDDTRTTPETDKPTHALSILNRLIQLLCILNAELHSTSKESKSGIRQYLVNWQGEVQSQHISTIFSNNPPQLDAIPTNFLNLFIVYIYLLRSEENQLRQQAVGVNTQGRYKLCGLDLQRITALMHSVKDTSILPPSCQLLHITLCESYTHNTDGIIGPDVRSYPQGIQPGAYGVSGTHGGARQSTMPQLQSTGLVGAQYDTSLDHQAEPMTFLSNHDFGLLYDETAIRDSPQGYQQTQQGQTYPPMSDIPTGNSSSEHDLSIPTDKALTRSGIAEPSSNRMGQPPLPPQWNPDAGSKDGAVSAECEPLTDHGPTPPLPHLLDNEEWLARYFDKIEDFEWLVIQLISREQY